MQASARLLGFETGGAAAAYWYHTGDILGHTGTGDPHATASMSGPVVASGALRRGGLFFPGGGRRFTGLFKRVEMWVTVFVKVTGVCRVAFEEDPELAGKGRVLRNVMQGEGNFYISILNVLM